MDALFAVHTPLQSQLALRLFDFINIKSKGTQFET